MSNFQLIQLCNSAWEAKTFTRMPTYTGLKQMARQQQLTKRGYEGLGVVDALINQIAYEDIAGEDLSVPDKCLSLVTFINL